MSKETRIQTLERKLAESQARVRVLEANDIATFVQAARGLRKSGEDNFKASGVILSVTNISGGVVVPPVLIEDGLSREAINALLEDVRRSYSSRVSLNQV